MLRAFTYPTLLIRKLPVVLQLVGKRELELRQLANLTLSLLQLAAKVRVLSSQLLLGGIEVTEGAVGFVKPGVNLSNLLLDLLSGFLGSGL